MLLIDEIDKADIEFPNDLLRELDRMEFFVYETRATVRARHRPVIVITSNNEKELPDAFLRRCFFHYIRFPDEETMARIVEVHFPGLKRELLRESLAAFFRRARDAGPEEEAHHLGAPRLDQAAGRRGHPGRGAARRRCRSKLLPPLYGALLAASHVIVHRPPMSSSNSTFTTLCRSGTMLMSSQLPERAVASMVAASASSVGAPRRAKRRACAGRS